MQRPRLRHALAFVVLAAVTGGTLALADVRRAGEPEGDAGIVVLAPDATTAPGAAVATPAVPAGPAVVLPDVRVAFTAFVAVADDAAARLAYHAAVEARDAGDYTLAADRFQRLADGDSPLAPFAALRAAQMLGLAGETEAAADAFAAVIEADALPASLHTLALLDAAALFEETGRLDAARAALLAVEPVPGASAGALAQARWQRALLLREDGDGGWYDLAILVMETAPHSLEARAALDALEEAEIVPPGMLAGLVEYRGFRNGDADERFRNLLALGVLDDGEAASAWFYLGAIAERFANREGAIEAYGNSLIADADSDLADDARYWRGRVAEELGRIGDAIVEYDLLVADYPDSRFVPDARMRAGVAAGLAGNTDDALARLAALAADGGSVGAEAARWHGILRERDGRTDVPAISAAAVDPIAYPAVLERSAASAIAPFPASALAERPSAFVVTSGVRAEIDAWLLATFGPRQQPEVPALESPLVRLALELARAGEPGVAGELLFTELNARRGQSYELLDLAFAAQEVALHDVTMVAAIRVLAPLSSARWLEAPRPLLMLAYPAPYLAETIAAAEEFGVPPLLLLALVRQESAFNPRAGSSAGAFGLTQVIEPTGASIAADLGEAWDFAGLAEPARALRYGAYYLGEQLRGFDGHMLAALAAYNGGPGNAAYWLDVQPFPGADGYIHGVEFTETRAYLEHLLENYGMYRYIYAGAAAPSLP